MIKKRLGETGLMVTPVSFGAMELRLLKERAPARRILEAVLDSGINFIDTSQDYGGSESLIGEYISRQRDRFLLATKCGCNLAGGEHVFTRSHIMGNLEDSLRKLRTDYIDLWQLHCVTPKDLPGGAGDDVVRAMEDARQAGKVRYTGVSFKNGKSTDPVYPTEHQEAYGVEMSGWGTFHSMQMVYGALTRTSEGKLKTIKESGTGIIARGVIKKYFDHYDHVVKAARLEELYGKDEGLSGFLVRFVLNVQEVDTMIIGSNNPGHIADNVRAAEKGPLPQDVFEEAKRRLDCVAANG